MKLYKREGRRFIETANPADRIGMYVDNSGLFFTKDKTQSSVGKCVMIEDGHYVIACIEDHYEKLTFTEAKRYKWKMCTHYDAFIPSIELLFYTAYRYPELFNKQKHYMSNSSFSNQFSGYSYVHGLYFGSGYRFWLYNVAGYGVHLSMKLFYKIPITS